jgi:alkanesulfonate monooxygenase SsuD/methylene tetrahydromethanopterin reductase-like flavin-dependent oxidoreductase (luciferase family)
VAHPNNPSDLSRRLARMELNAGPGTFGSLHRALEPGVTNRRVHSACSKQMPRAGRGEAIDYEGKFWTGKAARVVSEVWISGDSQSAIAQDAHLRPNFCTGFVSCETARNRRAAHHEAWGRERQSEPPGRVAQMILACVGDSQREVEEIAMPAMRTKLYELAKNSFGKRDDPSFIFDRALVERYQVKTWDELVRPGTVVDEEECIEEIEEISATAGEALLLQTRFGEVDRAFGSPVDPELHINAFGTSAVSAARRSSTADCT